MDRTPHRRAVTSRVVRPGQPAPADRGWRDATPEERIAAVWDLTLLCLAWSGEPAVNREFRDLLAEFNAHGVEYLLVGAHAMAAHGHVRATKDLDIWVRPAGDNTGRVLAALRAFGAPLHDLTEADLAAPGLVFQIGVAPLRIDIMTSIDGVAFAEAWPARLLTRFADQPAAVLSREHLIRNKSTDCTARVSMVILP
jgi:hypothetical protein